MTAIHIRKLLIHLLVNKILLVELSDPKKYDASTSFRVQSLISKNSQIIFSATPVFAEEVFFNCRTNTFKYGKSDRGGGRYV